MAAREIYRLDINIGVNGDDTSRRQLSSLERYTQQSERRLNRLNRIQASPSVRLNDRMTRPLNTIESRINSFSKTAIKKLAAVATAGTLILGGLGIGSTINTFMDFEAKMSNVAAISEATQSELKLLTDQAKQLGASTAFSASQAADGMANLASAGFSVNETISAMPGMLNLAAAGAVDIATASDIAASTLRGFGLEAKQATHVADVLAKTASATNAGITDTGEAMKYIAPVANAMGLSLEEVSASIGLMANSGIKGGQAGTTLRSALSRLASPSKEASNLMNKLGFAAFDSKGKMLSLSKIVQNLQNSTKNLTDEQKQNAISTIFGQEAMSGMLSLIQAGPQELSKLTQSFIKADGAAEKMAKTQQNNLKGALDQLNGAVETLKINVGEKLAPYIKEFAQWLTDKMPDIENSIMRVVDKVSDLAEKFNGLSSTSKKAILGISLGSVLLVPFIYTIGSISSGILSLIGLGPRVASFFGLFRGATVAASATSAVGTAATAAAGAGTAGGLAGLGTALGGAVVAAAPWLIVGAAVAGTGYAIYKGMTKEAIPAIDLFADKIEVTANETETANGQINDSFSQTTIKISDATKKAVGAFMELDRKASDYLNNLYVNSTRITSKNTNELVSQYTNMGTQIKAEMEKDYNARATTMQNFFKNSKALSDIEENAALTSIMQNNATKKAQIDGYIKEIQTILNKASKDNRMLTLEEQQTINTIQQNMKKNAVQTLSESEIEANVILGRIKDYGARITAEQASEVIKNAEKQRVGSVDAANRQFEETKATIEYMRDVTQSITADQASKLIADAERQKNESITKAQQLKDGVVEKLNSMNSEVASNVDTNTGNIKTRWNKFMDWWNNVFHLDTKTAVVTEVADGFRAMREYASGTNYHPGGLAVAGEVGRELFILPNGDSGLTNNSASLYNFPRGTKVIPNNKTEKILQRGTQVGLNNNVGKVKNTLDTKPVITKQRFTVAKPQVALAGGGTNANIDVEVQNNFNSNDDINTIVAEATKEFAYKLREALKNIKK